MKIRNRSLLHSVATFLMAVFVLPAFAEPLSENEVIGQSKAMEASGTGTSARGENSGVARYLNEDQDPDDQSSIEIMRIDHDTRMVIGGEDDTAVAVKRSY